MGADALKVAHLALDLFVDVVVVGISRCGVGIATIRVLVYRLCGSLGHVLGHAKLDGNGALQGLLLLGGQPVGVYERLREHIRRHGANHVKSHGVDLPRPLLQICAVSVGNFHAVLHFQEVLGEVVYLLVNALEHLALVGLAEDFSEAECLDACLQILVGGAIPIGLIGCVGVSAHSLPPPSSSLPKGSTGKSSS